MRQPQKLVKLQYEPGLTPAAQSMICLHHTLESLAMQAQGSRQLTPCVAIMTRATWGLTIH